jgi:hypothetical protein
MRSVRAALAIGLALIVVTGVLVLSQSPLRVLATNSTPLGAELAVTAASTSACQAGEQLARGTVAIRLSIGAFTGPAVRVKVLSGTRVIASGEHASGWDGASVTIPVRAVTHATSPVKICFAIPHPDGESVKLFGLHTAGAIALRTTTGQALNGRLSIEELGQERASWLTLLPSVARNMGFGRAWSGIWVVWLVVILMLAVTTLASRLILRESHG